MTDSREMRTSGKSLKRASPLISASVTGLLQLSDRRDIDDRLLSALVLRIGVGVAEGLRRADHRLFVSRVVVEDPIALLDGPQVLLRKRVLHAAPDGFLVLHELVKPVVGRFFFE